MRVYIESIKQAKRELAKTYREYKEGLIDSEQAKTRTYILRAIVETNFKYEFEERLDALENIKESAEVVIK